MAAQTNAFTTALKSARKRGMVALQNVNGCCRSCVDNASLNNASEQELPYAWTYGGQGNAITWIDDKPYYRDEINKKRKRTPWVNSFPSARASRIYINHGNGGAEIIVEELTKAGFDVQWDGAEHSCVEVVFAD